MRVECERCRALVPAELTIDGDAVVVGCAACGASVRVAARAVEAAPEVAPGPGCPKCGAPASDAEACPRCGLARAAAAGWAAAEVPPPPALAEAWAAVLAGWDEPAVHDRVAALALEHQALPWLARRYREAQRGRARDPVARARLERIASMTLAAVKATASTPTAPRRSALPYVLLVFALVVAAVLVAVQMSAARTRRDPAGPGRPATPVEPPPVRR